MINLLPCPFCGHEWPRIKERALLARKDRPSAYVVCPKCKARGPVAARANVAAERWNERAGEPV